MLEKNQRLIWNKKRSRGFAGTPKFDYSVLVFLIFVFLHLAAA